MRRRVCPCYIYVQQMDGFRSSSQVTRFIVYKPSREHWRQLRRLDCLLCAQQDLIPTRSANTGLTPTAQDKTSVGPNASARHTGFRSTPTRPFPGLVGETELAIWDEYRTVSGGTLWVTAPSPGNPAGRGQERLVDVHATFHTGDIPLSLP